jgi:hypothetical protein
MKFTMTAPCPKCPFRYDVKPYLSPDRCEEILDSITHQQQTFACHETTAFDDDGEPVQSDSEQHCAGALILLEKIEQPNQMMRICERLGMYDRTKLKMDSPVYGDDESMLNVYAGDAG